MEPLIFEKSSAGRQGVSLPDLDVPEIKNLIPQELLNDEIDLPELSEVDVVRHFTKLSQKNFSVDSGFYPLGSCTMKYNPKINEDISRMPGLSNIHPLQDGNTVQGILELLFNFEEYLKAIFGYEAFTLQPSAGAHGELTALLMIKEYFRCQGSGARCQVIIPDSAHGTNPASVAFVGYEVVQVRSNASGGVDLDALRAATGDDTAAMMLTNPNTLGLFDE
ncbi:MAG: aminomethyl-transferring glycine dehydrogenase subunit GcvPB, partial [bacterium]